MKTGQKQLSNSFSTGSGGALFEAHIQATFVTLMLSRGCTPCLPCWPIVEIKLQGKIDGYETDDLVVFIQDPVSSEKRKLYGQVKHSISVTANNKTFAEVVSAAWIDFNNVDLFQRGKDVIALITGPISATDTKGVCWLLEQARHTKDAKQFINRVEQTKFSSKAARDKLKAFREQLKKANGNVELSDEELFEFLKHFHLLGYDLDRKGSVVSSLVRSHISLFNRDIPQDIWNRVLTEVQDFNQHAGTITIDTLPEELVEYFKGPVLAHMPQELTKELAEAEEELVAASDWNSHPLANKMALVNLLGSWDERSRADKSVVSAIVGADYSEWIVEVRDILQLEDSPLVFQNGVWSINAREELWHQLGSRLFDEQLERFQKGVVEVLKSEDPAFEMPPEDRYTANLQGRALPHSEKLRQGISESLALIGSCGQSLTNCSVGLLETTAMLSVREILDESSWILWGSLDRLLLNLAEAAPEEFLRAVETAVAMAPSPFSTLFEQEGDGVFGKSYLAGLLWSLESVAWDENYLARVSVVLAEIAVLDPGGKWSNRPINSLTEIFLPWYPQTIATVEKRQVALKAVCAEQPHIGWTLLKSLLPNQYRTSTGTHKPDWRKTIPEDWKDGATREEFWEQSRFCSSLIVEQAGNDIHKLTELAGLIDSIPQPAFTLLLERLASEESVNLSEDERLPLWSSLSKLIAHHRRFPDADWSLDEGSLQQIEIATKNLAPQSPDLLHRRLFSEKDVYLLEGDGDWEEERKKLDQRRQEAVEQILETGGLPLVVEFSNSVDSPGLVGGSLAALDIQGVDDELLPSQLIRDSYKLWSFIASYSWRRRYMEGWQWFDNLTEADWTAHQKAALLCTLPFDKDAWDRARVELGEDEGEYWKYTPANSYESEDDIHIAVPKLLKYGRSNAALRCLARNLHQKKPINPELACRALLELVKSDKSKEQIDTYYIAEVIKALQDDENTDLDELFRVEWAYVPLFERENGVSPITLEDRLATDPNFFCELIQLIYRAEGEEKTRETNEHRLALATNAYRLLSKWERIPGTNSDGLFDAEAFSNWLEAVEEVVKTSGHYAVALIQLGDVLVHSPGDPNGLWIHSVIADALNNRNRESLRDGYSIGIKNSRGAHYVDPEGKPELELAQKYRERAEAVENEGFFRLATTLKEVADSYEREAERIIQNEGLPN